MKKLINNIGLSCLGLCLNSCVDFIDNAPDDTLTLEMVFDDKVRNTRPILGNVERLWL